jgi:ABC-2 type transport system permease protein
MRVYLTAARLSLRRYLAYRSSAVAGVATNTVFGFIRAYVLVALWRQKPEINGWDLADACTYAFLTQALIAPMGVFMSGTELGPRIRNGDVALDLYRPVDFQAWWFALDTGRAVGSGMLRSLPPVVIGALFFPFALPVSPLRWAAFLLCCGVGYLVSFALRYLISLVAFWTLDERGMASILLAVGFLCSGMILPLTIMPGLLGSVVQLTPWAAMIQIPASVLFGTQAGGLGYALAFGLAWALALLLAGRLLTGAARRKVVVQGG